MIKIKRNEPRGCSVLNELLAMEKISAATNKENKIIKKPNLGIRVWFENY